MTEVQWMDCESKLSRECQKALRELTRRPGEWLEARKVLMKYIDEVDKLTEVDNMENSNE